MNKDYLLRSFPGTGLPGLVLTLILFLSGPIFIYSQATDATEGPLIGVTEFEIKQNDHPAATPGKFLEKYRPPRTNEIAERKDPPCGKNEDQARNCQKEYLFPTRPNNDEVGPAAEITPPNTPKEKFHWRAAIIQSGIFLGIQHGFRMTQEKTRKEFEGPFFADWGKSVKNLRGWKDGDGRFTNYVAHPMQGGVTGRIFINNSDRAKKHDFSNSKAYWNSRFKAFVWSTVWSTQFELGLLSEANLGNVGLRRKNGKSTMGFVDLVITPTVGTGVVIGEDAIDKYVLKGWIERNRKKSDLRIKVWRSVLTPTTSFTNLLRGKVPWYRENR